MFHTRTVAIEDGRAQLRVRLAAIAAGATLMVLAPQGDRTVGALVVVLYVVAACLVRVGAGRVRGEPLTAIGAGTDVAYATALVSALPLASPSWVLYAFAIGNASLVYGSWGSVAGTAASIVAYDLALALRAGDASAIQLWPIQMLIALGLIAAELVLKIARSLDERRALHVLAVAQRDIAAATTERELTRRLKTHILTSFGADRAEVVRDDTAIEAIWANARIPLGARGLSVVARFTDPTARGVAAARDLVTGAGPLLDVLATRDEQREAAAVTDRLVLALERVTAESDTVSLLAQLGMSGAVPGGRVSVVRLADATLIAGEPLPRAVAELARDTRAPGVVRGAVLDAALGSAGQVLAVAAAGPAAVLLSIADREPTPAELRALSLVGGVSGALLARIRERDELGERLGELRVLADSLRNDLRGREDTLRTTVHELRTPLTSVSAYGQLIARNLQSALQQVAQLDRLIGDLRGDASPAARLVLEDADLLQEAKDAAQRQRLLHDAAVNVKGDGADLRIRADRGRLAQVLDNLLDNAVKYSPKGSAVRVTVRRDGGEVVVEVRDEGKGIAPADLDKVFDRYYRSDEALKSTTGMGIGLALARDIVQAHGGRIWAESAGAGKGSTFTLALPAAAAVTAS